MHLILCSAARRLAVLVVASLGFVAAPFVSDARVGAFPAAAGFLALVLLVVGLLALARARHFVRQSERPAAGARTAEVYRTPAADRVAPDHELEESGAARAAALALLVLAFSGALTIVAAAAR
jgi:hypothetical protein